MNHRTRLTPRLMAYAQDVRTRFPRIVAGTTVADLDALADQVCTSLDDFPLTTGVLGCTLFEHGQAYTAIREGLRRDEPTRYRFTLAHELSEILLQRYLNALPDQSQREHVCDAFAAELLLPHAAVLASVDVVIQAHAGGPGPSDETLDQLARRMALTYEVSPAVARISIAECFIADPRMDSACPATILLKLLQEGRHYSDARE